MTLRAVSKTSILAIALMVLAACGSGATPTVLPGGNGGPATAPPATQGGGPTTADGLCGVLTADLALAALGVPVAEPTGGDVVPRPNGIYCHYAAADDDNSTVEAQLKDMTRAEFDQSVEFFGVTEPVDGVGEVAYQLERSTMGGAGAFVLAFANGRRVSVLINNDGDQAAMNAAAQQIAVKVLATP